MMELLAAVSVIANVISTIIYAFSAYKKMKEPPRDVVWETALKLCTSNGKVADADDFADTYEQLALFKRNGCKMPEGTTLAAATIASEQSLR